MISIFQGRYIPNSLGLPVKAITYGKLVLLSENGGFSTFQGVVDPGNGRTGPAFLELSPSFLLREASNPVCPFLQDISLKIVDKVQFPLNQFRTRFFRKLGRFRMKRRCTSGNLFAIFLSESDDTETKSNYSSSTSTPLQKGVASREYAERRANPIQSDSGYKTSEST